MRSDVGVPAGAQVPLVLVSPTGESADRFVRWQGTLGRLARAERFAIVEAAPADSIQLFVRGDTVALPLAGLIDIAAEGARLRKEREKLDGDIAKIQAKLANADFVARAPEEVVDEQRERQAEAELRRAKIDEALARLQGLA